MGRPHRADFTFAFHHVMNRAGAKRWVFNSDEHRHIFLAILQHVVETDKIEVHAYCLMGNHYHLLLRTPKANLAEAMHRLSSMFTKRFNRLEKADGPLFRGRYKSRIVGEDSYMRQLCRYIHRNPVAVGIVSRAQDYPWSSYRAYCRESECPSWLMVNELPGYFEGPNPITAMQAFIEADMQTEIDEMGLEKLLQDGKSSNDAKTNMSDRCVTKPKIERQIKLPVASLEQVATHVSKYYGVDNASLFLCKPGALNKAREFSIYLAREEAGMKMYDVAKVFGIGRASASSVLSRLKRQIRTDTDLEKELVDIRTAIRTSRS